MPVRARFMRCDIHAASPDVWQGRGDRADPDTWPLVQGPVDVVLFEGWSLGFSPVDDVQAAAVSPDLVAVNARLSQYVENWDSCVDAWLVSCKTGTCIVSTDACCQRVNANAHVPCNPVLVEVGHCRANAKCLLHLLRSTPRLPVRQVGDVHHILQSKTQPAIIMCSSVDGVATISSVLESDTIGL